MKLMKKLEDTFSAAAFAEAGEFETARQILKEGGREDGLKTGKALKDNKYGEGIAHTPVRT